MKLTQENAHEYEGKKVDAHRRRFHYYPLEVKKGSRGEYDVIDRNGVRMAIAPERDLFNGIEFDFIVPESSEELMEVPK